MSGCDMGEARRIVRLLDGRAGSGLIRGPMSGCGYCSITWSTLADTYDEDYGDGYEIRMRRGDGRWMIEAVGFYDGGYVCGVGSVPIAYCPMRGRKLGEEEA